MAKRKKSVEKKPIEQYEHKDKKRLNNPQVGLVTPKTDKDGKKKKYQYDPHLDPQLQWAGKAEHTSFEVPTVSLHVHERIDPKTIIETAKKENNDPVQMSLFAKEGKPLREAIEFYKHKEGWTNRMIAGDSLLVMNSLLEKEGMGGKVQMVYIDPPYGIKYGSNFQPFINKRDVKDGKDEDLTAEPEMIKAFRDTWELGVHSYLTYLRDRLLLTKELLHENGSVFVQISDENIHHVKEILDEVFNKENFVSIIAFRKTAGFSSALISSLNDFIVWYAKDIKKIKYNQLFLEKTEGIDKGTQYKYVELQDRSRRKLTKEEINDNTLLPKGSKIYRLTSLTSQGYSENTSKPFTYKDVEYFPPSNRHWTCTLDGLNRLVELGRIEVTARTLAYVRYLEDFPVFQLSNIWNDTGTGSFTEPKVYVVQTGTKAVERCLLMTTNPGDLVLDITCGSGSTAVVSEKSGRRWITCDTSRVALTLAKQRLMTSFFEYYKLSYPNEGLGSGFEYNKVPHITLGDIANDNPIKYESLIDKPKIDKSVIRITGPFTVEAVPSPVAKSLEDIENEKSASDESVVNSGETLRQNEWREELLRTGVRAKGGKMINFSRVELLPGTRFLHAEAETSDNAPKKVLVSFGPEHAPIEQRQVEEAWQEARQFSPDILLFAAFQFDEEASKDIDEMKPETTGMQFLKAQMNADLLTGDLKKKRSSNESFWLVGQPDIQVKEIKKGDDKGKVQIEVLGFDYYNPKTGDVESGGKKNIAMWMLDTDYDNRSLFPSQVFFPMAGEKEGWARLAKNLKAEIDEDRIEAFKGTISLPFSKPKSCQVAVKIIDDRGIESLRIVRL
jgi:adenine-specific DNA-methyltransferase